MYLLCLLGEWQTQFDPLATFKGVFYLDNQNSVSVDMMKSAQYPLRLLDDLELEAQVTPISMGTLAMVIAGNVFSTVTYQCMY